MPTICWSLKVFNNIAISRLFIESYPARRLACHHSEFCGSLCVETCVNYITTQLSICIHEISFYCLHSATVHLLFATESSDFIAPYKYMLPTLRVRFIYCLYWYTLYIYYRLLVSTVQCLLQWTIW